MQPLFNSLNRVVTILSDLIFFQIVQMIEKIWNCENDFVFLKSLLCNQMSILLIFLVFFSGDVLVELEYGLIIF